jgi:hypothetical protein
MKGLERRDNNNSEARKEGEETEDRPHNSWKEEKKREEGEEVSISLQILDGEEERKAVVAAKARSV